MKKAINTPLRTSALAAIMGLHGLALLSSATAAPTASASVSQVSDTRLRAEAGSRWATLGFKTRMVAVNGTELFVAEGGTGPTVLLLHGYPQSGEIWRKVAPKLARSHHLIIPDLRGMGLSAIPATGYDLATVSEDIHQLVKTFGADPIAIVGHDWGGSVGAAYGLRYRSEVTRLAFLESAVPGAGFEQLWTFTKPNPGFTFIPFLLMGEKEGTDDTTVALVQGREDVFLHHLWAGFSGDKVAGPFTAWSPYIAAMRRAGLIASSASYYRAAYTSADQVSALVSASPLTIPVLAISGERAVGNQEETLVHAFASNIVRSVVVPGAGHFVAEERPDAVATEVARFLDQLAAVK